MKFLGALTASIVWLSSMATALPTAEGQILSSRDSLNSSRLVYYPAPKNNCRGIGFLVLPGGGYSYVSLPREGSNSTKYLNERGYDAWVLDYAAADKAPTPLYPAPQNEALEAVRYIRSLNKVKKLGVWGYSAGGHLAATTVTNPEAELDFGILAYPVITMEEPLTHKGSRNNLIGENPSPELVEKLSAQNLVSESTPPIFLFHTANDATVPVENSILFIQSMIKYDRPFQSLILPKGSHGIGLAFDDPVLNWTSELDRWLQYSV
ncbi:unnamed protein product [Clonostachys rhizophaga]|uniref:Peptidase S9 prolyl oligopeptidase catalytic domain-containing protein n=1 Tax=Clonostachys rhizophaga TaxID=160324 RepID=A0A9N9VCB7_9HYPO|nr:unnamed protein product [Clonostachys rhizophaga]